MRHGEVRNWRIVKTCETHEQSVMEKWCAVCEKWVEVAGVVGAVKFLAEHKHGYKEAP